MKNLRQNGSILISLIITLPFLIVIVASYMSLSVGSLNVARSDQFQTHSQFTADAGSDAAVQQINQDNDWTGTAGEVELHNDGSVRTTYETSVTDDGDDRKIITTTGRTYFPASATTPKASININVTLRKVTSGNFSIVTGVGGLYMQNSAKVLGGDVFVNGELVMENTSQIGLNGNSANVNVAHQNCPDPPDGSYPSLCASGENGEPIEITNNAHIYADVRANNQVDGSGMSNGGLIASSGVTPEPLPTHDRATQKANIQTTSSDSYYLECDSNNDTRTWPARLKIEGDVVVSKKCIIELEGDVWITGTLTLQNSASIVVSDSISLGGQNTVDPNKPTVMVDGSSGIQVQNSAEIRGNTSDVGSQFITYWSRAGCSPDCADVTGQDLYDTREDITIELQNNASAPNTIFFARWSQASIGNGGDIGAVVGQTVRLSNSAAITFSSSLGVGTSYWVLDSYRRSF